MEETVKKIFDLYNTIDKTLFVMLVGIPGSGKSTVAAKLCANQNTLYFSSDAVRKELFGDEAIQDSPSTVFATLNARVIKAANDATSHKIVVYDATNINRKKRLGLLSQLHNVYTVCVIVYADKRTCIERDASRTRTVGESVITRMIENFQVPHYTEGWHTIMFTKNDQKSLALSDIDLGFPHDNPHHLGSVQAHIDRVIQCALAMQEEIPGEREQLLKLATLHDIGKAYTKTFTNARGELTDTAHYYNHQNVGAYLVLGLDCVYFNTDEERLFYSWLVNMHMEPFFAESKYYKTLPANLKNLLMAFNRLDVAGA